MSAMRFDQVPDPERRVIHASVAGVAPTAPLLAAVVYPNEAYPQATFRRIVDHCRFRALKLAGVLQHPACEDPAHRCDVILEELGRGIRTELFERRGRDARGCRLDVAALTEVSGHIARSLDERPDLLILNKFGKVEAEGRGFSFLIAKAIEQGTPTLIGVPERNLHEWRWFADEMAVELGDHVEAILEWLDQIRSDHRSHLIESC
jgi:hypothetical protein